MTTAATFVHVHGKVYHLPPCICMYTPHSARTSTTTVYIYMYPCDVVSWLVAVSRLVIDVTLDITMVAEPYAHSSIGRGITGHQVLDITGTRSAYLPCIELLISRTWNFSPNWQACHSCTDGQTLHLSPTPSPWTLIPARSTSSSWWPPTPSLLQQGTNRHA